MIDWQPGDAAVCVRGFGPERTCPCCGRKVTPPEVGKTYSVAGVESMPYGHGENIFLLLTGKPKDWWLHTHFRKATDADLQEKDQKRVAEPETVG